jgi:CBS domain-containing protein
VDTTQIPTLPRLDRIRVEDVMHAGLIGCDPAAPLSVIARIFAEEQIHALVLSGVERTGAGERLPWRVITDHDLLRALDAPGERVTAAALAGAAVITVDVEESLDRAVQLMTSCEVTHVLVVEDGDPVGIVSALDVARAAGGV